MSEKEIKHYMTGLQLILSELDVKKINEAILTLHNARMKKQNIFVIGNGGSAATASHIVCDLNKNTQTNGVPNFHCFDLTSQPTMTAYANDEGYDNIFVNQLRGLINADDILIAISTSGKSKNIIYAVDFANRVGAVVIGLTGFNGGELKRKSTINIHVDSDCIEQIEDIHLVVGHIFCRELREMIIRRVVEK